jgi:hypothetical protein
MGERRRVTGATDRPGDDGDSTHGVEVQPVDVGRASMCHGPRSE